MLWNAKSNWNEYGVNLWYLCCWNIVFGTSSVFEYAISFSMLFVPKSGFW